MTSPRPRFRIVQRPWCRDPNQLILPSQARFDIEERIWWWWEFIAFTCTLEEAEALLLKIKKQRENVIETKVVKEYN
jgi:hypothetical protein